jgi:DNA-binding ferritin-like protein (Dps family)
MEVILNIVRHAMNMMSARDELKLLFKNRTNILGLVDPKTMFEPYSELSQTNYSKIDNFKNFISLFKISANIVYKPIFLSGNPRAEAIFVNGVCSSFEMAKFQANTISELTGMDVELLYNKTDGLLFDLVECFQDRLQNEISKAAEQVAKRIVEKVTSQDNVYIFAYSQGTIITTKALQILNNVLDKKHKAKIKVFNFATATKYYQVNDIHTEHYINSKDPVCLIGYLEYQEQISGTAYIKNKKGHLLLADYLQCLDTFEDFNNSSLSQIIIKKD